MLATVGDVEVQPLSAMDRQQMDRRARRDDVIKGSVGAGVGLVAGIGVKAIRRKKMQISHLAIYTVVGSVLGVLMGRYTTPALRYMGYYE